MRYRNIYESNIFQYTQQYLSLTQKKKKIQKMFRRLQSVISPMSAMRIDPNLQSPNQLQSRLHIVTQYLINSTKQFDSWMELQTHNRFHLCLFELYERAVEGYQGKAKKINEEEMISIIQFYTMLMINCKDQLLICKLVSDDFLIQLCQLKRIPKSLALDLQPYQINLIKAYMSKITPQIVKYMILQDRFKIFETCIGLFHSKLGTGTVQFTTMSNVVLNIMKKVDSIPYLWQNIWSTQGLQLLYTESFQFIMHQLCGSRSLKNITESSDFIEKQIEQKYQNKIQQSIEKPKHEGQEQKQNKESNQDPQQSLNTNQATEEQKQEKKQTIDQNPTQIPVQSPLEQKKQELPNIPIPKPQKQKQKDTQFSYKNIDNIQQIVLFLVQVRSSVSTPSISQQIQQYSYLYLQEILQVICKYKKYLSKIYSYSILHSLFKTYNFQQEAVEAVLQLCLPQIITYFQDNQQDSQEQNQKEKDKQKEQFKKFVESEKINQVACRSIFVLCKIVCSKYSNLSQRVIDLSMQSEKISTIIKLRQKILKILVKRIQFFNEQIDKSPPSYLVLFIKNLLLIIFNIKLAITTSVQINNNSNTGNKVYKCNLNSDYLLKLNQCILELFLTYTAQLKKLMNKNQLWGNIIKWYEQCSIKVSQNILVQPDTYEHLSEDQWYLTMMIYQYIKNYRYMIVQETTLDPKSIKQQKFYHTTFTSPGIHYEPGTTINQEVTLLCPCLFHYNYQQIPVVVIEDKECLIVGVKNNQKQFKIMINVQFKDIQGFIYGNNHNTQGKNREEPPKFIKINLRGAQQITLQFSNPKIVGNCFKEYLIKSKDLMRQRQLKFLNNWIKDYQVDTEKCLEKVKHNLKKQDYIMP